MRALIAPAFLLFLLLPGSSSANGFDAYAGVGLGGIVNVTDGTGLLIHGGGGYRLNDWFVLGLEGRAGLPPGSNSFSLLPYLRASLLPRRVFNPYLRGGLGELFIVEEGDFEVSANHTLWGALGLNLGAKTVSFFTEFSLGAFKDVDFAYLSLSIGLTYHRY